AVTIESYGYEYDGSGIFLYTNPGDIEDDYDEAINVYEADISNNSIGTNTCWNFFPCNITGDYGVTSVLIDSIVTGSLGDPFRIVWANGNERDCPNCPTEHQNGYHSTAPPSCAKNHLTVGALNSNDDSQTTFTSWGPCDDGRLKPDVSAPGCQSSDDFGVTSCTAGGGYDSMCGTSMASPTVCGLGALLLQDFRAHYPGELDFRNSTLRVVLAQTAQDRGNPGPDYSFGYGSARIQPAVDLMRSGNFLEAEVDQGGIYSVLVVVEPGDPELKVTLAWDDAPGTPNVDPALVNDLDLVVYDPSSAQHFPWLLDPDNPSDPAVRTQADHVNNIEQVFVDSPASGAWRVEIHGFNVPVGAQAFSLCATPLLIQCSTQGVISLDRVKYQCESVANIQVVDCDLNTDDGLIETVQVTIESDTEPAGETVLLTETGPETAAFRGTIALSTTDAAGVLQVTEGDTVTATYIDEDDGFGGTDIVVEATAVVDCQGPVISNVQAVDIGPLDATITFETDEPAQGVVRYGLSCGSLIEEAMASGYQTSHSVHLVGLEDDTTYFYAVDAEDEAGNTASDDNGGNCYTFSTPEVPDYFTEEFLGDFDLGNKTVTFQPDGSVSFYRACTEDASAFPTDPAGGTVLSLGDDDFSTLTLSGGQTVSLYGASYDTFYVGSNGYITFVAGDQEYWETLAWHFGLPRISGLFRDLNPSGSPWCPGEGDCCVANLTPGCEDVGCCETVCAMDDYCCVFEWDEFCADMAIGACPICSPFPPRETRQDIPRNGTAPGADPTVSWKELGDRVAVTYENVPEFGTSNSNSFQIEMFFDDVIRITWLSLGATYGISGLSAGDGLPSVFAESDLSAYGICDCLAVTPGEGLSSSGYEGGPFTPECATYTLTNNCDTSVNWTAAGTQTWVDVDPAGGTLAASGSAPVDVCINANANGLPPDTHNDTVTITNTTSGVAQTRHVTLEVFDGLVVTPTDDFASEGEEGGPFEPECATYTLTNSGSASLEWAATGTQAWLDVDPSGGTLAVSAFTTVDVCINTNANSLTWDVYTDTVTFTNETSGMTQTRGVELTVWEPCLPPPAAGSPDPADEAAGVPVDTDLEWNGQGVEVSVRLRGGATGTSSVSLAYLPEGWVTPKRAASTSLVGPGYRAARSSMAVLLLASGADPTILRTALAAFPDVDAVDYFDASMAPPSVGTLTAYDVVVAMSDSPFADSIATGNALADYVDVGGKVVQAVATFATGGGWELSGRFVTDGVYEPFAHGGPEFYPHSLGTFDTGHPIMAGVTALTDGLPAGVAVRPGAQWVADWNNGTPLVATQGTSVVGINIYAFDSGDYTGDVALLFHNALVWLVEDDDHCATTYDVYFGTDNPPATMICADIGRKVCDPGVLDFLTTYYWQVVARTPAGETSGPVWSFTTVCPPADQPTQPAGEEGYEKIRCISMVPGNPGQQTALRVTLTNLPAPFSGFNGTEMWVGEPREVSENAGKVNHEPGWPDFMSANLQCTPYCMDWSTAGVLHVTDDDIIPSAVYDVQAIGCECDFDDEADYSTPLTITTSTWGDLVRNCTTCPCGAPDGTVGVPTDVTAALDKFKNLRPP
ncbi:MAG: S8 family serine peptidase, partial [Phycisphaerales bacterium]